MTEKLIESGPEAISGKQCSGSFTGTDLKGLPFTIEGKFSNLTIKDVAER